MSNRKSCGTRRRLMKGALGAAVAVWYPAARGDDPFAPPPLTYPSLDLPGPGGLTARDLLNRGYWPVPALPPATAGLESAG